MSLSLNELTYNGTAVSVVAIECMLTSQIASYAGLALQILLFVYIYNHIYLNIQ